MKQPFLNNMFPGLYGPPYAPNYEARTVDIIIYTYYTPANEDYKCPNCDQENCQDMECDEDDDKVDFYKDKYQLDVPKINLKKVTLQTILELLPKDVDPNDVKIKLELDAGAFGINGHSMTFYYTKRIPADPEGYKADQIKYDAAYKEYEKQKAIYDEWTKEESIKDLEEKLNKLKKK